MKYSQKKEEKKYNEVKSPTREQPAIKHREFFSRCEMFNGKLYLTLHIYKFRILV